MGVKTAGGALAGSAFGQWVGHGVGVAKNWATGTDAYQYARDLKGDASNYMKKIGGTAAGRKVGAAFSQIGADVRGNAMPGFISKMGDKKIKALEERISNRKSVEDAVKSAYDAGKFNSDDADVRALKLREQQLATMKQNAPSRTFVDDHGVTHELSDSDYNDVLADYNQNIFDMENAIAKDKKALMRTLEDRVASGELRNDDVSRALQKEVAYDSANGFEHYDTSEDRHSASDGGTINGKEVAGWKSELAEAKDKRIAQQEAAKANK